MLLEHATPARSRGSGTSGRVLHASSRQHARRACYRFSHARTVLLEQQASDETCVRRPLLGMTSSAACLPVGRHAALLVIPARLPHEQCSQGLVALGARSAPSMLTDPLAPHAAVAACSAAYPCASPPASRLLAGLPACQHAVLVATSSTRLSPRAYLAPLQCGRWPHLDASLTP